MRTLSNHVIKGLLVLIMLAVGGNKTTRTHRYSPFGFVDARTFGDTQWMSCVQLAVMRSGVRSPSAPPFKESIR